MATSEIRFTNAIIGLCASLLDWPNPLNELGFEPCGVEKEITILLKNADRQVKPDLILASSAANEAICAEIKSGGVKSDQVARYLALRATNLLDAMPVGVTPGLLKHDVIYVTSEDNVDSISRGLAAASAEFSIISFGNSKITLLLGRPNCPSFVGAFSNGIEFDPDNWPMHFVPFNHDSPVADLAPFVMQSVSRFILAGRSFNIRDLTQQAVPHWNLCGRVEQKVLGDKIAELTDDAKEYELKDYIRRPDKPRDWGTFEQPPQGARQIQRLQQQVQKFVERKQQRTLIQSSFLDTYLWVVEEEPGPDFTETEE